MHSVPEIARPAVCLAGRANCFALTFEDMAAALGGVRDRAELTPGFFLGHQLHSLAGHQEDWSTFRDSITAERLAALSWEEQKEFRAALERVERALTALSAQLSRLRG